MLTILTLIVCAYLAGSEHSGLALATVVFITFVRYGYGLALDLLPPHVDPSRLRPPEKGLNRSTRWWSALAWPCCRCPPSRAHVAL